MALPICIGACLRASFYIPSPPFFLIVLATPPPMMSNILAGLTIASLGNSVILPTITVKVNFLDISFASSPGRKYVAEYILYKVLPFSVLGFC
ncbi:MAG: hypothetical protein QXF79_00245 [Ignisphaera sp.]